MTRRSIALYGTSQPAQQEIPLRAGPLSALFVNGALRNIRLQDVGVIRGINTARSSFTNPRARVCEKLCYPVGPPPQSSSSVIA